MALDNSLGSVPPEYLADIRQVAHSLMGVSEASLSKAMQERATKKESAPHLATYSAQVHNEAQLRRLVSEAITASQWFSVTPLPDDCWEFTVKLENSQRLEDWIATHVKNYKDV